MSKSALFAVFTTFLLAACQDQPLEPNLSPAEAAFAKGGVQVDKTTGDVYWYGGDGALRSAEFVAFEEATPGGFQGNLHYEVYGEDEETVIGSLDMWVACATVEDGDAWFAGPVVDRWGDEVSGGEWFAVWVSDGGTPGVDGDQFLGQWGDDTACGWDEGRYADPGYGPFSVVQGNLQVHAY